MAVGTVVAPAGLNFVVGSTTSWLYTADQRPLPYGAPGFAMHADGRRIPFNADALRCHLAELQQVDAAWRVHLERVRMRLPRVAVPPQTAWRLTEVCLRDDELRLRAFVVRGAALLAALRLVPEYHVPGLRKPAGYYLFDMVENGLTLLSVHAASRPSTS